MADLISHLELFATKLRMPFFEYLDNHFCCDSKMIDDNKNTIVWSKMENGQEQLTYEYVAIAIESENALRYDGDWEKAAKNIDWNNAKSFFLSTDEFLAGVSRRWKHIYEDSHIDVFKSEDFYIIARNDKVSFERLNPTSIKLKIKNREIIVNQKDK